MGECRVCAHVFLVLVQGLLYTILTNSKEARDEVNFLDADTWPEILRQHLEDATGEEVSLALCACRAGFWKLLTRHCCTLSVARENDLHVPTLRRNDNQGAKKREIALVRWGLQRRARVLV